MENKEFKPYIPAEKITPEMTVTSVIMGILLAVIFGAANAYLGLRVGMTVSASIPAAVIAMGVIRVLLRKNSILESNMVQTIGSAGESLAAGAIFTLPALFLWASEGKLQEKPGILEITAIALIGGLLGIFFMVPLRNALIVKEHGVLPYPEGTACSEVLLAGEKYVLKNLEKIVIPAEALAMSEVTDRTEKVVDISEYLPKDVQLLDENAGSVVVTVNVEKFIPSGGINTHSFSYVL